MAPCMDLIMTFFVSILLAKKLSIGVAMHFALACAGRALLSLKSCRE
jgi:hypothetical protein